VDFEIRSKRIHLCTATRIGLDVNKWNMPEGVVLADPTFYQPSEIDILIGIEDFLEAIRVEKCTMGTNMTTLINTSFGWVIGGSKRLPTEPERYKRNFGQDQPSPDVIVSYIWKAEGYQTP